MKITFKVLIVLMLAISSKTINAQNDLNKTGYMVFNIPKPIPFGPIYSFQLAVPDTSMVKVCIVDSSASAIKTIFEGIVAERLTNYYWDTTTDENISAKSGFYFFVVEATLKTTSSVKMYYKSSFPVLLIK
jgi:hypothetical protein